MLRRMAKRLGLSEEQVAKLRAASEAAKPAESTASDDDARAKMREIVRRKAERMLNQRRTVNKASERKTLRPWSAIPRTECAPRSECPRHRHGFAVAGGDQ